VILTLDLGTSATKVVVWDEDGPRAIGRAAVETTHPAGDRAEQDPAAWWSSVVRACAAARSDAASTFAAVDAVGCAAARQTFVPVTAGGEPVGPALVWSDRRATADAERLAHALGGADAAHQRSGVILDGAAVPAKAAWLARCEPDRWAAARWVLSPRDLVVWRMTGELATDRTSASATGFYAADGSVLPELAAVADGRLPAVVRPDAVVGTLRADPAAELGLTPGIPVVIGAGDRPCEVLGSGASAERPMVSWGTTANVSVPVGVRPGPVPTGVFATQAVDGGWLLEGGLSAAGSFVAWVSALTGLDAHEIMARAAAAPAGARGVMAMPWLGGARAPWWRDGARGAFVGLSFVHDAGDVARAVVESVAWEVLRCMRASGSVRIGDPLSGGAAPAVALTLAGSGATVEPWARVLTAVTGLPAVRRRSGEAASSGAALLTARAVGVVYDLDRVDPVTDVVTPDAAMVARYRDLRDDADAAARAVADLGPGAAT
jgi:xylulokinase